MRELLETISAWRSEGVGFGRAVLIRSFGSAPRPPGATLLVAEDGRIAGSVSGGCVEAACIEEVHAARAAGEPRVVRYGISDETAWAVGLACGGTIDVLIEPRVSAELLDAASASQDRVVVTQLPADAPPDDGQPAIDGMPTAIAAALRTGGSSVIWVDGRQHFVETFPQPPRLIVFGAVDVARSLVRLAHELGFRVWVVDAREAFLTRERFADADELLLGWPDELVERLALAPADSVAVLTHDPKLDDPAIVAAIRARCRYVGVIGSRRTQAARRDRLLAGGLSEDELSRLRGPIGLDLGGRAPAETALAIMAEVVAVRHGASGGPLVAR